MFKIIKKSQKSKARLGKLRTKHGLIETPFFMPIATRGSVKALTSNDLNSLNNQIILGNTYHLYLKPGLKVISKYKGLHRFINWPKSILTDSGGFQVFSLNNSDMVKVKENGVTFKSVYDGSKHLFTPLKVIRMQETFGSDIMMVLDECVKNPCTKKQAERAVLKTLKWAKQSLKTKKKNKQLLFCIVQGSLYKDLRIECAKALSKSNFDGYAVGGLAVGEDEKEMLKVLDYTIPELPDDKPHYLMGVGYPKQIVEAVKRGVDMFDCVVPTREARHSRLYLGNLKSNTTINVKTAKFKNDLNAINSKSNIPELREYTKGYLRHLFSVNEPLALRLATLNNVEFYLNLMKEIRMAIKNNKL